MFKRAKHKTNHIQNTERSYFLCVLLVRAKKTNRAFVFTIVTIFFSNSFAFKETSETSPQKMWCPFFYKQQFALNSRILESSIDLFSFRKNSQSISSLKDEKTLSSRRKISRLFNGCCVPGVLDVIHLDVSPTL